MSPKPAVERSSAESPVKLDWRGIDTVLLDMDGTLLDLHFDNHFWQEVVPECYARQNGLPSAEAKRRIEERYREKSGTLEWYSVDYWSATLQLDIVALKKNCAGRIAVLPGARPFLDALRAHGCGVFLVTNAHRKSLTLKMACTGLEDAFDGLVSSHEIGYPKEDPAFWPALQGTIPHDPQRTLFIDDSLPVLRAARQAGIAHLLTIQRPDTQAAAREIDEFPALRCLTDIQPGCP